MTLAGDWILDNRISKLGHRSWKIIQEWKDWKNRKAF